MNKLYILFAFLIFANNSHAVSRFDPILKEIIKFQEFKIESKEEIDKAQNKNETIKNKICDNKILEKYSNKSNEYQDEHIYKLYDLAIKLQNNEISGSDFLEQLLKDRLHDQIYSRSNILISQTYFLNMPPLDENLFELWAEGSADECIQYNMLVRKNNITRYQLSVIIIKKIFQLLDIKEISPNTLKLLRASPFLWPILQNQTNDLGHHDQSGGYIKIKIYMDYFKCSLTRAIANIILGLTCPKWEKEKKLYDLYLYESHFIPKEKFIPSKMLGAPKDSGVTVKLTDYENGECDDLPYPDFLKVQHERPFMEFPNFFDTFNFDLLEDEIETPENATPQAVEQLIEPKNIGSNTNNLEQTDASEKKPEDIIDHSEPASKIDNEIIDEVYLAPSGIRKFHNLMPKAPYSPLNLKKKKQRFVDAIFNSKTSHTISFGEFKNFWKKMGGKIIEDTGSSHKQLIGPNGDALYGVSSHNDAHTYGKNTIKYFRAALYYIGCRPS